MSITWATARAKLRDSLWKSTSALTDTDCDEALHASCLELERERQWLWLEKLKVLDPLVAASTRIAVPSDFSAARSICFRRTAGQTLDPPLEPITLGRLRALQPVTSATGAPTFYALSGGEFHFDQAAPIGAIFELVYIARTPVDVEVGVAAALVSGNNTLNRAQKAVLSLSGHYACLGKLRNEEEATRKLALYQRILEGLQSEDDEAREDLNGGLIQPDDSYQVMAWGC